MSDTRIVGKIIQIAVSSGSSGQLPDNVYALCDDGTVWRFAIKLNNQRWDPLPPIVPTGVGFA
jgi:hypothetical protein